MEKKSHSSMVEQGARRSLKGSPKKEAEDLRRKRRIRNAAPSRKQFVIDEYLRAKLQYAAEAGKALTESWKEFCST